MVGERHFLDLLAGAEGAVDTEGINLVEDFHGKEPERAAVDPGLGGGEAGECVVRLAAIGGAAVVHDPAAHGTREGVPGVRRREVGGGHHRPVLLQLVREVGDAELGEGREEERVRLLGREGEEMRRRVPGEAREEERAELAHVGWEGGGGDVERQCLVAHGRALGEAADEGHHGVPRGLREAGRAGVGVPGGELAP